MGKLANYRNKRLGTSVVISTGETATVTEYRKSTDLEITYSNGEVRAHSNWKYFCSKDNLPPSEKKRKRRTKKKITRNERHNEKRNERLGASIVISTGETATITAYRKATDLEITYSNGEVRAHSNWRYFCSKDNLTPSEGKRRVREKLGHKLTDHTGTTFLSIKEASKAWKKPLSTLQLRLEKGWSTEEALTKPPDTGCHSRKPINDHEGRSFNSIRELCQFHNINEVIFRSRLYAGWSVKEAIVIPKGKRRKLLSEGKEKL